MTEKRMMVVIETITGEQKDLKKLKNIYKKILS